MGQKVNPYGFRLGVIRQSKSRWFAEGKAYRQYLVEDLKIRQFVEEALKAASLSNVTIERTSDTLTVTVETAKPGIVIGRQGKDVDILRQKIEKMTGHKVRVNVEETKEPDINAQLVADSIARQIERRVSYRRAMKQAVDRAMSMGAGGIRCSVSGRLGGAEIARTEGVGPEGRVPLHTLRADIELGLAEAKTGYGHIGVKVWVYKGEILPPKKTEVRVEPAEVLTSAPEEPESIREARAAAAAYDAEMAAAQAAAAPAEAAPAEAAVAADADDVVIAEALEESPSPEAAESEGE
jgi:small subunit ribosomal protein S3